jgi:hypothetical protein
MFQSGQFLLDAHAVLECSVLCFARLCQLHAQARDRLQIARKLCRQLPGVGLPVRLELLVLLAQALFGVLNLSFDQLGRTLCLIGALTHVLGDVEIGETFRDACGCCRIVAYVGDAKCVDVTAARDGLHVARAHLLGHILHNLTRTFLFVKVHFQDDLLEARAAQNLCSDAGQAIFD